MLTTSDTTSRFRAALLDREDSGILRELRSLVPVSAVEVLLGGKPAINFASNDYLGLSQHPQLKARAIEYVERYGVGSPSSRLLSGNLDVYERLEKKLASVKGMESALIFSSGYQLSSTVIPTLFGSESVLAVDRLAHSSILQGAGKGTASWFRYMHDDVSDLQTKLQSERFQSRTERWILTESVFSMDGDRCDLDALVRIARQLKAGLYIDEAHATGVFGRHGMGLVTKEHGVDLVMGTFGKGLGSFGGYIACSSIIRDYLINFCPGIIYSTALPPAVLGAIDAALDLIPGPEMDAARAQLLEQSEDLRVKVKKLGFDTAQSSTQIVPLIVGADKSAVSLAAFLEEHGVYAPAIRQPTVPADSARVRLSLSSKHTAEHIDLLVDLLRRWNAES